ncbi:hypothetical protein R1flu_003693 [Riccia fluitans]|uniref:Transmembrane protein n=1 Tax=Riccia fluitans TaxID=41844 RepID=A0ABD1Y9R0_9MARC
MKKWKDLDDGEESWKRTVATWTAPVEALVQVEAAQRFIRFVVFLATLESRQTVILCVVLFLSASFLFCVSGSREAEEKVSKAKQFREELWSTSRTLQRCASERRRQ